MIINKLNLVTVQSQLTLAEQCVETELAYYRQANQLLPTSDEEKAWQRKEEQYEVLHPGAVFPGQYDSSLYARFLLEHHGHSLHRYMASHLHPLAWAWWAKQVDFWNPCLV